MTDPKQKTGHFIVFVICMMGCQLTMAQKGDEKMLSELNARFIKNFVNQDTASHSQIIHPDFVCIESNGKIVNRKDYLDDWAHAYAQSGYTAFSYTDEKIRIFGNIALVRSRTVFKRSRDGQISDGNSVYTDTYLKENGKWRCIQAQITAVGK